jgi:hypothetical protein
VKTTKTGKSATTAATKGNDKKIQTTKNSKVTKSNVKADNDQKKVDSGKNNNKKPEPPKGGKKGGAKPEPVVNDAPVTKPVKPGKGGKDKDGVKPEPLPVEPSVAVVDDTPAPAPAPAPAPGKKVVAFALLLQGGKKLSKTLLFTEAKDESDHANQKKVTSDVSKAEKKPTMAIRRKISLAEETQEELTERILKELEEQNAAFTREAATQMCTRCNRNLVSPEFWVDKHLGYCEECATILKLGQSKEARKVEYTLGSMGGDSLDEADDEDFEGPDAADLKEAEEDLADFDES